MENLEQQCIDYYNSGKTLRETETKFNVSYNNLYSLLKEKNLIRINGKISPDGKTKLCSTCKNFFTFDKFHKRTETSHGLSPSCKDCSNKNNKEKRIPYSQLSQEQKQLILNSNKISRSKIKPELKILKAALKRSKEKSLEFNITIEDIIIPEYCPILNIKLFSSLRKTDNSPSLDRIDNSKGYIKGNVHIVSDRVNRLKNNANKEELEKISNYFNK
jgi:hypothetical protein